MKRHHIHLAIFALCIGCSNGDNNTDNNAENNANNQSNTTSNTPNNDNSNNPNSDNNTSGGWSATLTGADASLPAPGGPSVVLTRTASMSMLIGAAGAAGATMNVTFPEEVNIGDHTAGNFSVAYAGDFDTRCTGTSVVFSFTAVEGSPAGTFTGDVMCDGAAAQITGQFGS